MSSNLDQMRAIQIREKFWLSSFKTWQREAILSVLEGKDTLINFPTWWGKSLCYQWPASISKSHITLVTSPHIWLMEDQVDHLASVWVPAYCIHSWLTEQEREVRFIGVKQWKWRLLYLSPELLLGWKFMEEIWRTPFNRFVVDEAQCISTWWSWFRPDYMRLWIAARKLMIQQRIACSATLDNNIKTDIIRYLWIKENFAEHNSSPYRDNLEFSVKNFPKNYTGKKLRFEKLWVTKNLIEEFSEDGATIIYCRTIDEAVTLFYDLRRSFKDVYLFHSKLLHSDKMETLNYFTEKQKPIVVATSAFWMWIDKPNVRLIIHHGNPYSLLEYIQAWWRAWRDGKKSRIVWFYKEWSFEKDNFFQWKKEIPSLKFVENIYKHLYKLIKDNNGTDYDINNFYRHMNFRVESSQNIKNPQKYMDFVKTSIHILKLSWILIENEIGLEIKNLVYGSHSHQKIIEATEMLKRSEEKNTEQIWRYFNHESPNQETLLKIAWIE